MSKLDRNELARMRRAIGALPEPIGAVYRLHLFDGLDYPAIALKVGIDAAEVERRIAEAIIAIDHALRAPDAGGGA